MVKNAAEGKADVRSANQKQGFSHTDRRILYHASN